MATVKPVYLSPTTGRLTIIPTGDVIDSAILPAGPTGPTGPAGSTGPTGPAGGGGGGGSGAITVRVASTAALTLSAPGATIDGVTMVSGDLVLVKDQASSPTNGIYTWNGAASAMTRDTVMDTSAEALTGTLVAVSEGTTNQTTLWQLATFAPITLDTTGLSFAKISSSDSIAIATDITVDFGTIPIYAKQFTVTVPGLEVGQRVLCSPSGYTPTGVYFDEFEFAPISWVGKVTATDTLVLLGSSPDKISGQRIVQVNVRVSTATMFITAGASNTPDYIVQGTNII